MGFCNPVSHCYRLQVTPPPPVAVMTTWLMSAKGSSLEKGTAVGEWVPLLVTGIWVGHLNVSYSLQPCPRLPQNEPQPSREEPLALPCPLPPTALPIPLKVLL